MAGVLLHSYQYQRMPAELSVYLRAGGCRASWGGLGRVGSLATEYD